MSTSPSPLLASSVLQGNAELAVLVCGVHGVLHIGCRFELAPHGSLKIFAWRWTGHECAAASGRAGARPSIQRRDPRHCAPRMRVKVCTGIELRLNGIIQTADTLKWISSRFSAQRRIPIETIKVTSERSFKRTRRVVDGRPRNTLFRSDGHMNDLADTPAALGVILGPPGLARVVSDATAEATTRARGPNDSVSGLW